MLAFPADHTSSVWGGRLCLAVVNSLQWRRSDAPDDTLDSYGRLVDLAAASGWLEDPESLRVAAKREPVPADLVLARAVDLREHLYQIFSAVAASETPSGVAMSRLNDTFGQALSQLVLKPLDGGAGLGWRSSVDANLPLWLMAVSAADLLTSDQQDRIKQCPGERCGWIFLDATRNRSRRWCEDATCGNRERARRYYQRHRAS